MKQSNALLKISRYSKVKWVHSRNPDKINEERVCFHITVWVPQSRGFAAGILLQLQWIPTNDELRTIPKTSETAALSFAEGSSIIEVVWGRPNYTLHEISISENHHPKLDPVFIESDQVLMNIDCWGCWSSAFGENPTMASKSHPPRIPVKYFVLIFNAWLSLSTFNFHCQRRSGKQPPGLPRGGQPNSFPVDSKSQERWCESVFGHIFVPQHGGYASDLSGDGS